MHKPVCQTLLCAESPVEVEGPVVAVGHQELGLAEEGEHVDCVEHRRLQSVNGGAQRERSATHVQTKKKFNTCARIRACVADTLHVNPWLWITSRLR